MHSISFRSLFVTAAALAPAVAQRLPDYEPALFDVVLDTDHTVIQPTQGPPRTVDNGVFVFHDVHIPQGVTVRGVGSRPMVWIVTGSFVVDGRLSVDGGDGQRPSGVPSAMFPLAGGRGGAGGGAGGSGSPQVALRSAQGGSGGGPGGGSGGQIACLAGQQRGAGGGGGSFATQGDPWFHSPALPGNSFLQRGGVGGPGGSGPSGAATRTLAGGAAGLTLFSDGLPGNDFFGYAFDLASFSFVRGELPFPIGGNGGGGGGDRSANCIATDPQFFADLRGGGGGGGGGCLIVLAYGRVTVGATGRITANGGHGGVGDQSGTGEQGGGGGGGSGGMILLASRHEIVLEVKGETYANDDYDFVLSADGGVGRGYGFVAFPGGFKYPANGTPTTPGTAYDEEPRGGFGGMGLIQLAAPIGFNRDGTNTLFDDHIVLKKNGRVLVGAEKQRYLAWRGYPNAQGVPVDDRGNPTNIGDQEGDLRPTPILMPFF